ncbi:MAG: putative glycoside hydrolase [Minisyncoccia bacterium]
MKWTVSLVGAASLFFILSYVLVPQLTEFEYSSVRNDEKVEAKEITSTTQAEKIPVDTREVITHVPLPTPLRAIYMTSCVAGTTDFRNDLVALVEETEINAIVIDIKDYSGTISFPAQSPEWSSAWAEARCGTKDMQAFIKTLHDKGIFVIGRITVFQDPFYTKIRPDLAVHKASDGSVWHDRKGLSFMDVGSKDYWDHIIVLATDAYDIGFDELNFDYVRYPSDGNMEDISFPNSMKSEYGKDKPANLEAFFKYLNEKLDDDSRFTKVLHENTGRASSTPWTSVDLFGMTTTNTDDLSIGQVQERAAPYFDFVAPMVYPSHYPSGFIGLGNPNDYPYKIVHYAMSEGEKRMRATTTSVAGFAHERIGTSTPALYTKPSFTGDRLRTWIQDFDYGGDYDAADVRAQIQASYDAGVHSFMIWAPSNRYTKGALLLP